MVNTVPRRTAAGDAVATAYGAALHPMDGLSLNVECRYDRIAHANRPYDAASVRSRVPPSAFDRSPDNELYDRGCDLVEAAAAIRRVAGVPHAARAVPAVLGCIEAALRELAEATAGLEATTRASIAPHPRSCEAPGLRPRLERMHRGYANLQQALADAERAAAAARPLAGRVLTLGDTARADHPRSDVGMDRGRTFGE